MPVHGCSNTLPDSAILQYQMNPYVSKSIAVSNGNAPPLCYFETASMPMWTRRSSRQSSINCTNNIVAKPSQPVAQQHNHERRGVSWALQQHQLRLFDPTCRCWAQSKPRSLSDQKGSCITFHARKKRPFGLRRKNIGCQPTKGGSQVG